MKDVEDLVEEAVETVIEESKEEEPLPEIVEPEVVPAPVEDVPEPEPVSEESEVEEPATKDDEIATIINNLSADVPIIAEAAPPKVLEDSADESEPEAPSMPEVAKETEKVKKEFCELPWANHDGTEVTDEQKDEIKEAVVEVIEDHIVETAEEAAIDDFTDDDDEPSEPTDDVVKEEVMEEIVKVEEVSPKVKKTQCVLPWAVDDT